MSSVSKPTSGAYLYHFEHRNSTPGYWHNKSGDLIVSARTLWAAMQAEPHLQINCRSPYLMLAGMSFELLFKAHCVGAGKPIRAIYCLCELAESAEIILSKQQMEVLEVLSGYIFWDGRYPTPKDYKRLKSHWQAEAEVLDQMHSDNQTAATPLSDKLGMDALLQFWRPWSDLYLDKYA